MRSALRIPSILAALTLGLLVSDAGARPPSAKQRADSGSVTKQVTRTGPGGAARTLQKERSWQRGDGRTESRTTWTDARGRQATRDAEVTLDREAGRVTRDMTFTGRDGRTRNRQDVATRTENGREVTSSISRRDGSVVSRDASVSRDPEAGSWEKDVTWTDADGGTHSRRVVRTRRVEPAEQP